MYKGYNLFLDDEIFDAYICFGLKQHGKHKKTVNDQIESFRGPDGKLRASKITASWFPNIECDVFISHAHVDSRLALGFSGFLSEAFGLTSFIDSAAWGYSEKLLHMIDDKYCYNSGSETYSYQLRNRSTTHVNMMLSVSLAKMIDTCECLFFINTPQSIKPNSFIDGSSTESPWIYSEIAMSKIIRRQPSDLRLAKSIKEGRFVADSALSVVYDINTSHLIDLKLKDIVLWIENSNESKRFDALDILYYMK